MVLMDGREGRAVVGAGPGVGFGVQGLGIRVWGSWLGVQGLGFRVWGSGFIVHGFESGVGV